MLKKITVDAVEPGMYVHELCGSWFDNPFWAPSFLLRDASDVSKLQASGVRELWIDTARSHPNLSVAATPAEAPDVITVGTMASEEAMDPAEFKFVAQPESTIGDEISKAARIVQQSRDAVAHMFEDARMGRLTGTAHAMPIVEEIAASVMRNSEALISLVRLKQADDYTYMHSVAVCAMMVALAKQVGLADEQVRLYGLAGLLHDIGKMAIPLDILNKPGRLTEDEFLRVKQHPRAGYEILNRASDIPPVVLDVCLHHHERIDGQGYPGKQKGDGISVAARMGSICDVYDAITSNRPYKKGWSPAVSLQKMAAWSKEGHFDLKLLAAFVKCIGIYPVGTVVKLKSNRLAVVTDTSKSLLRPVLKVFFSVSSMAYLSPTTLDLLVANAAEGIQSVEAPEKWGISSVERFWLDQ